MNKIERNNSYDLLRLLSCLAVILLHVNFLYFGDKTLTPSSSYLWIVESIINIITRFSVPCFVMISGAFLLSDEKNKDFAYFYKKQLVKVLLPTIIIGFAILTCSIINTRDIVGNITQVIEGTFYNYWYIYMTIGLYLSTPFVIRLKSTLTNKQYKLSSIVLMIWSIISQATTTYRFPYAIGVVFAFLSYFIIGNIIYENSIKEKLCISTLVTLCLLSVIITFIWRFIGHNNRMFVYEAYSNFFSPFIICYSICLFTIFTRINIKGNYNKFSKYTLYVYLFHTFVYQYLYRIIEQNKNINELMKISALFVGAAIVSWVLSLVFYKLFYKLKNRLK